MSDTREHIVHCFAERLPDGQWQAFSIQFGLAVQGESLTEVRAKLLSLIREYVNDAVFGDDRDYCEQLLARRAPLRIRFKYHLLRILGGLRSPKRKEALFDEWYDGAVAC